MTRFRENPKWVHFSGSGIFGKRSITPDQDSSRTWDHFQTKDKHLFHLYSALERNYYSRFWENPKWVHFSAFWIIGKGSITQERDFSRTCGFRRKLRDIMFFHFKQKKVHINGLDFRQNAKNLVFQHKCCKISILRFFFENPAPLRFVVYGSLTSCNKPT